MAATVTATPTSALVDEEVTIVMHGLERHQAVTLVSVLLEEKIKMMSYAHYEADENGVIDVTTMPSIGGSYKGIERMAFIWAMQLTPDQKYGTRLMKRNVLTPIKIEVKVYRGHIQVTDPENIHSDCLAKTKLERWYLSKEVERIEVSRGKIVATLFVPKGTGPYPGVLDMFGTVGGLVEYRAALLASRGFVTLALAYFWPSRGMVDNLEYFENAVELLASHPKVSPGGVGVVGVSKGAELAHLVAIISHKVRAVVAINGPPINAGSDFTYKDQAFRSHYFPSLMKKEGGICFTFEEDMDLMTGEEVLPIERSKAKHLLIQATDDGGCPSETAQVLTKRMVDHGRPAEDCQTLVYQDAGHLIEPPYSPHFRAAYHKLYDDIFIWGGWTKPHAHAQEDSWRRIQDFLRTTLTSSVKTLSHI